MGEKISSESLKNIELSKDDLGYWLHFKASNGKEAGLFIVAFRHKSGQRSDHEGSSIIDQTIGSWAEDQYAAQEEKEDKSESQLAPLVAEDFIGYVKACMMDNDQRYAKTGDERTLGRHDAYYDIYRRLIK